MSNKIFIAKFQSFFEYALNINIRRHISLASASIRVSYKNRDKYNNCTDCTIQPLENEITISSSTYVQKLSNYITFKYRNDFDFAKTYTWASLCCLSVAYSWYRHCYMIKDRLPTGWTVRWSNPRRGQIFRTCPDRPWGPLSLLYNGYRVFPGSKIGPGSDANPSPPSRAEVKNRVELYLYSP